MCINCVFDEGLVSISYKAFNNNKVTPLKSGRLNEQLTREGGHTDNKSMIKILNTVIHEEMQIEATVRG